MEQPGFSTRFFIGQVPLNQLENRVNKEKRWGDRVQVRIIGVDPAEGELTHNNDLRTAMVIRPTSQGTFNRGSSGITGGEIVIGMFVSGPQEYDLNLINI